MAEVGVARGFVAGPGPGVGCAPGGGAAGPREMLWCGCGGCVFEWFIDGEKGSGHHVGRQQGARACEGEDGEAMNIVHAQIENRVKQRN